MEAATLSERRREPVVPRGLAYVLILMVVGLAWLAGALGGRWERFAPTAYADVRSAITGQEDSLRRGVFAEGALWLLSDSGELWTVREQAGGAAKDSAAASVFDICARNGHLVTASGARRKPATWNLREQRDGRWRDLGSVRTRGEALVGLVCEPERVIVLTSARMIEMGGHAPREVNLTNRVPANLPATTTILATPPEVFVGINAGEWGGGLLRIDRRTGAVQDIGIVEPINGLALSPGAHGCVVAAAGLAHLVVEGRLVEVCGAGVRTLYSEDCQRRQPEPGKRPSCMTPFFGVVKTRGGVLAVAPGEVLKLDPPAEPQQADLPPSRSYGPFTVGFAEGYAVVANSANERHALSGATPMIVPR